jgi:hypothetical protein
MQIDSTRFITSTAAADLLLGNLTVEVNRVQDPLEISSLNNVL